MKKIYILILVLLAGFLAAISFGWGYDRGKRAAQKSIGVVVRDTTIIDTVFREVPKVLTSRVVDTILVHVPVYQRDTIVIRDSVDALLPIEQKEYGDNYYHAWVSGYRPSLDSIRVYHPVGIRTIERTVTRQTRWGIGIQAGYGAHIGESGVQLAPYVGIGVTYNLFSWNFGKDRLKKGY